MRTGSIILAGGRSKRMGRPKSRCTSRVRPCSGRTVATLLGCSAPVRRRCAGPARNCPRCRRPPGSSPTKYPTRAARGIGRGELRFCAAKTCSASRMPCFATGCDAPFLPAAVVAWLVDRLGDAPLVMPFALGHLQPLCAV
jgi:molybdopterin-guanine dinucleotide biosynthesis protein A